MIKQTIGMYFEPYFAEMNSKIAQIEADLDNLKAEKNKCAWKKDVRRLYNSDVWITGCGCEIVAINGTLLKNACVKYYCPSCGKEIEEAGL